MTHPPITVDRFPDTAKRLLSAFPQVLQAEVQAALAYVPMSDIPPTRDDIGPVTLSGESVGIPGRIYFPEPDAAALSGLNKTSLSILACLYTRHHNGFIRQQYLKGLFDADVFWAPPFVLQLAGEYVIEILAEINQNLQRLPAGAYVAFIRENPPFVRLLKHRILSYWDVYYRTAFPYFQDYAGFQIADRLGLWEKGDISHLLKRQAVARARRVGNRSVPHSPVHSPAKRAQEMSMSSYNLLNTTLICPNCDQNAEVEVELFFGDTTQMSQLSIGETCPWLPGKAVQNGGRPENGDLDGDGYAECLNCGADFDVLVQVRGDVIRGVTLDPQRPGFVIPAPQPAPAQSPVWKITPQIQPTGEITPSQQWKLTPEISAVLEQLSACRVDVFASRGSDDYTMLVRLDLTREQQDEVEGLMRRLAKEVQGSLDYIDWYPHGYKFRISPRASRA